MSLCRFRTSYSTTGSTTNLAIGIDHTKNYRIEFVFRFLEREESEEIYFEFFFIMINNFHSTRTSDIIINSLLDSQCLLQLLLLLLYSIETVFAASSTRPLEEYV